MAAMTAVSREELAEHLADLVDERLLRPLEALLESAAIDSLRRLVVLNAKTWASRLTDPDDGVAAATATHLIATLYGGAGPFEPPRDWWRSPLGQVVLRRLGHPDVERVSYATAGTMLDITRQGVHDLTARGKLVRHADGGVTTASVRRRALAQSG
jgi:hypothetical protein